MAVCKTKCQSLLLAIIANGCVRAYKNYTLFYKYYKCLHIHTYTCTHRHIRTYICTQVHTGTHIRTGTHVHTRTRIHKYTHVHTQWRTVTNRIWRRDHWPKSTGLTHSLRNNPYKIIPSVTTIGGRWGECCRGCSVHLSILRTCQRPTINSCMERAGTIINHPNHVISRLTDVINKLWQILYLNCRYACVQ